MTVKNTKTEETQLDSGITTLNPTIYDTILPGTHDSAAYTTRPDLVSRTTFPPLLFKPIRAAVATVQTDFARTQTMSVFEQLCAGARFLDIRVTKRPPASADPTFWTHHGMVLCVPLASVIDQINRFHDLHPRNTVVTVFRSNALTAEECADLTAFVHKRVKHQVYNGDAHFLRSVPMSTLPPNIFAGLEGDLLDIPWGQDPWLDTFSERRKITFLAKLIAATPLRSKRNDLLVIGWTVTPSVLDIILHTGSLGFLRATVLAAASKLNNSFDRFLKDHNYHISTTANVIFFDAFTTKLANQVQSIKKTVPDKEQATDL